MCRRTVAYLIAAGMFVLALVSALQPVSAQPGVAGGKVGGGKGGGKGPGIAAVRWPPPGPPAAKGLPWKMPAKGATLYTSADASKAAAADAMEMSKTVLAEEMYKVRYISLHNIPEEFREWYHQAISLLVNSLSRIKDITIPARLGPGQILVRINLNDYDIDPKDWDKQGDIDPYFQQKYLETPLKVREVTKARYIEKKVPYEDDTDDEGYWYKYADGTYKKFIKYKIVKEEVKETVQEQKAGKTEKKQTPGAVWLDGPGIATLAGLLQTKTPILRGDWWVVNGFKPPTYYNLLRLKTLDDAKELAAFDERVVKVTDSKATVVVSGSRGMVQRVARNNRILRRINTAYGGWWETFDYEASVGEKNVINNFLNVKRDGGEIIWNLPNGLQAYFLVNGKDERVDEVPTKIAVDYKAQDITVVNGRSCLWCHIQGMQPFRSDFKAHTTPKGLIDIGIQVKRVLPGVNGEKGEEVIDLKAAIQLSRDIRRVFETPNFGEIVKLDNLRYNNAVKAATGQTAATMASRFLALYDDYQETLVNDIKLVYEAGRPDFDVKRALAVKLEGRNNMVLLQQLLTPPREIRRDHFEEAYDTFARSLVAIRGLPPVPTHPPVPPPRK